MWIFLAVFLAIYAPIVTLGSLSLDLQAIFFLLIISFVVITGKINAIFYKSNMVFLIIVTMLISYGLLLVLFNSGNGLHVALRPMRILITLIGCLSIVYLMFNSRNKTPVEAYIFYAIALHSLIMIVQFLYPDFKMFIYQYTVNIERIQGARMFYSVAGLTNGGGAQLSLYQSVGVLLSPLVLKGVASLKGKVFVYVCTLTCLISVLISGRSGLLAILVFFPIIYLFSKNKVTLSYGLLMKKISMYFIMLTTLFLVVNINYSFLSANEEVYQGVMDISKRTGSFLSGENSTISYLLEHHLASIPDAKTFLFGNPEILDSDFKGPTRMLNSDIGYIRILFSYGIIGSILHYLFYLLIIYFSYNAYKYQKELKSLALFSIIFSIIILIFNAKEVFVFTRMGFSITAIMLFYVLHVTHINKKNSYISRNQQV